MSIINGPTWCGAFRSSSWRNGDISQLCKGSRDLRGMYSYSIRTVLRWCAIYGT